MTCKRDTNGNIIGWDRESIADDGFTPTGVILGPTLNLAGVMANAVRLKTPVECLHVCKLADTGDWELFYKPGVIPGTGYTDRAILPKPQSLRPTMPDTPNHAPEDLLNWLHQNADTVRQLLRQSPDTYHKRWLDKRRQQGKCYRCGDPLGACKHKACDTCRAKTRQQHHNRKA